MTGWLRALPHQIPFRAASSAQRIDDSTIAGTMLVSAGDALAEGEPISQLLIFEAMAQIGGALAFGVDAEPAHLSAIDRAELSSPVVVGDRIDLRVTLDAHFGAIFRFSGTATRDGEQVATARFYLAGKSQQDDA